MRENKCVRTFNHEVTASAAKTCGGVVLRACFLVVLGLGEVSAF